MQSTRNLPVFLRYLMPSSSGQKNKPLGGKNNASCWRINGPQVVAWIVPMIGLHETSSLCIFGSSEKCLRFRVPHIQWSHRVTYNMPFISSGHKNCPHKQFIITSDASFLKVCAWWTQERCQNGFAKDLFHSSGGATSHTVRNSVFVSAMAHTNLELTLVLNIMMPSRTTAFGWQIMSYPQFLHL
jgi:hypothetical protein